MDKEINLFFELLKNEVAKTFLKENNASSSDIKNWKGNDITQFQEDLFAKVKARVSEKWFYTYFKKTPEKLPRIDMLNLLSKYVGVEDWNAFKIKHKTSDVKKRSIKPLLFIFIGILTLVRVFWPASKNEFNFCFVDAVKNKSIVKTRLDITVLQKNETPLYFKTDSLGCFSYKSTDEKIRFVVKSPYHKTDTITRSITSNYNATIKLATDDYALMLDYYVNGKVKDWEKHKDELHRIIDKDAQVYRLFGDDIGVEIYSKNDFIRLSTTPTSVLKRIKILEKKLKEGKIIKLKFIMI